MQATKTNNKYQLKISGFERNLYKSDDSSCMFRGSTLLCNNLIQTYYHSTLSHQLCFDANGIHLAWPRKPFIMDPRNNAGLLFMSKLQFKTKMEFNKIHQILFN